MTRAAIRVHAIEPRSRANGPGTRFVVWFQGCSLGCPGCFNPGTHAVANSADDAGADSAGADSAGADDAGRDGLDSVDGLVARIAAEHARRPLDGVTLSGGEPFEQPEAALALVEGVRARTPLSVLMFSGYTLEDIRAQPLGTAILDHVDVLVDGRYEAPLRLGRGLRGSRNQRIHLLTARYTMAEVEATPEAEVRIDAHGNVTLTGVNPIVLKATR